MIHRSHFIKTWSARGIRTMVINKVEGKGVWRKINGQIPHWNDPHEGSKYSVVLYRGTKKQKSRTLADAMRAKRAAAKAQAAPQVELQEPCTDPQGEIAA